MKNLHRNQKIDKVGRILIPKALRQEYGLESGMEVALFEHVDSAKNTYLCVAPAEVGNRETYMVAASVLNELGLDVPDELLELVGE